MVTEELEFQISQYVDGTLSGADRQMVDDAVASDPRARKILAEYRRLDTLLMHCEARPSIPWDRFADQISMVIDKAKAPAIAGRIGFQWNTWSFRMRIAAAMLVAGTAWFAVRHSSPVKTPAVNNPPAAIIDVSGPAPEVAAGPGVIDVSVHPSELAKNKESSTYAQGGVAHPPKVAIGAPPKSDEHVH